MLNWLRYLPLKWRKRENYCVPGGPNFASAERLSMVIGGSRLTIRAPRHRPTRKVFGQAKPLTIDALSRALSAKYGEGYMANRHWGFTTLLSRSWAFWGPWMTGAKAQLTLSINLVGRLDQFAYGGEISFFHPKALENVLVDYLNDLFGHKGRNSGKPHYAGPIAWQPHHHFPVFSASFDIHSTEREPYNADSPEERFFVFPITHDRFVEVVFRRSIYQINGYDPNFDITPIDQLERAILDSLQLELSPSTQAEWDKVKAACGGMSLTDTFPPLRWPTDAFVPKPMDPEQQAVLDWAEAQLNAARAAYGDDIIK